MNVNATEDDLRAVAEALKLAAILDDRAPRADRARIAAWAERVHANRIERRDLLDGLQAFYDRPQERAIGIGDLLAEAKRIKRDRLDREADELRDARQHAQAHKAADTAGVLAGIPFGSTTKTPRLLAAEAALQTCTNRAEAMAATREFTAAKREAKETA